VRELLQEDISGACVEAELGGRGEAGVVRQQAVRERAEDVAAAHRVVARPLLGGGVVAAGAGGRGLGEHVGDAEGVHAEEQRFFPPQVAAGAVQGLDGEACHRSDHLPDTTESTHHQQATVRGRGRTARWGSFALLRRQIWTQKNHAKGNDLDRH